MHPFALSTLDDPAAAIASHARDPELAFIAGGTDLIGLMKDRVVLPERLLDINGLPGMARVELLPDGGLRIGALARMSDVAANAELRRRFPVIADAGSGPWCGVSDDQRPARGGHADRRDITKQGGRRRPAPAAAVTATEA